MQSVWNINGPCHNGETYQTFLRLAASNRFIHEMHIKYMRVLKYSSFFARCGATVLKVGTISRAEGAKMFVDTHFGDTWVHESEHCSF